MVFGFIEGRTRVTNLLHYCESPRHLKTNYPKTITQNKFRFREGRTRVVNLKLPCVISPTTNWKGDRQNYVLEGRTTTHNSHSPTVNHCKALLQCKQVISKNVTFHQNVKNIKINKMIKHKKHQNAKMKNIKIDQKTSKIGGV